jgi:uncharacterized membrane protein YjfL (UPF0719 family)
METTTTTSHANLRNLAIKNGLIWGVISIVIMLVFYYVLPTLMGSFVFTGITLVIGIGLAVFFCLDLRKQAGGYWTFKEALLNIFIMFLISIAVSYIFTVVFGKYIDTSYPEHMKEMVMSKTESTYKSVGIQGDQLDEAMSKLSTQLDKQFRPSFYEMIVGFGIAAVMYFIFALIFAAIFKKQRPFYMPTEE